MINNQKLIKSVCDISNQGNVVVLVDLLLRTSLKMKEVVGAVAEGNRKELLEELLKRSGASINAAVFGAAKGNRKKLLKELLTKPGASIKSWLEVQRQVIAKNC